MDTERTNSNKKNKKKSNRNQNKNQNETEEKFVITTKNELTTKDENNNSQDLTSTFKNIEILIPNKLQSLGNKPRNKYSSSYLIKKQNNCNNLIKQKINFPKQSALKILINKSHTEKSNETFNQSNSFLLNKEIYNSKEQNSNKDLIKNKKKLPSNKYVIKMAKSSKNLRKKNIAKLLNSPCNSYKSKNHSSKKSINNNLLIHENSNKIINNKLLCIPKSESQIKNSNFHDDNRSQNKQKQNMKNKKIIKNSFKNRLSNDSSNIIRTTKSLKTPKILINNTPFKKNKNASSISSLTPISKSRNSGSNFKFESNCTSTSRNRSLFHPEKKNKFQKKKKIKLNFSNFMREYNNNYNCYKNKKKSQTFLIANKIQEEKFCTILLSNKPNEIKDANKMLNIITMDEVHKKIKESIDQYDKEELIKEIHELETNDICEAIEKLPIINNSSVSNDNKSNYKNNEDNFNINESNKSKYINNNENNIYNSSSKKKLMIYNDKFRELIHKGLVYDSLDDEEIEEIEINNFYIAPNSITVYLIDSIILISSLIQLLYFPIYLAYNLKFCRNILSIHQIMFYLIDLFYILDLITGFFRAYYNFDDFLIKNRNKICKRYLKNWFFIDFIEAIPLYIILNIMENECKDNNIYFSNYYNININKLKYILPLIKTVKIYKVISTNKILKKIKSILNDYDFFFQYKIVLFTNFVILSSINISSCILIFLGRNSNPGWISECNLQNESFGYIYLNSIYYLMTTLTTVGYGDIIVSSFTERIYQIILLIVGIIAYSWSISYMSNYIKKIQEKSINYEKKISILEEIKLSSENFSIELYDKILRYLQYNRDDKKSNNEILFDCLPYPLNNTLFIEMYKDIIHQFKDLKTCENSNFIVKVVTSFKPVLSVKNDILVQEGDFIEDVIFVKEGIISLEACIDLDCIQECIESYLNEEGFGKSSKLISSKSKKFESCLYSFKNSFNTKELKINFSNFNKEKEKETNKNNKKYLRILDIRKSEYYGDILMYLNERASLRVRVKSKKAELLYLNKTDAIEISTLYPNIWKRSVKKSLYNMKQIKNLTRKTLIYFSKLNGIVLNEKLYKNTNISDLSTQKSYFTSDSQTIENTIRSFKSGNEEENEVSNNINNSISSVIYEEDNENIESPLSNSLKRKIKGTNKKNTQILNFNNKKTNTKINYNSPEKNVNKINIEQNSKQNDIENSKGCKIEKLTIFNYINNFSDYSENKNHCCPILNENIINSEIHSNEKFNEHKFLQSDFSESRKNSICIDKDKKNIDKKFIINYIDNELYLKDEKKLKNINHPLKINDKKIKRFENLIIVNNAATTISSIYENLNQISKHRFSKDMILRRKTLQFLMEESNKVSTNFSLFDTNIISKTKIINPLQTLQFSKKYQDTNSKYKIKSKNFNIKEELQSISSPIKDAFSLKDMNSIYQMESSPKLSKGSIKYMSPELKKSNYIKKNCGGSFKNHNIHRSVKNLNKGETHKLFENVGKKFCKKNENMQNLVDAKENQELNFYGKMGTLRGNNNNIVTISSNNEIFKSSTKKNYLDMISHNISEDQQTLNNPQEFYMRFFTNIVKKKISTRKKSIKTKKEINAKKIGEVNKNKIRSNKHLLDNKDKGKVKYIGSSKRPRSTSDVTKSSI